jgi:hypothetical protein
MAGRGVKRLRGVSRRRLALAAAPLAVLAVAACAPVPTSSQSSVAARTPARATVTPAPKPAAIPTTAPAPAPAPAPTPVPAPTGSTRYFHAGSPWNTPIPAGSALDARHAVVARYFGTSAPAVADLYEFGVPIWTADASTPRHRIDCTMQWGTCALEGRQVPIPNGATPSFGSDGAMVVVDPAASTSYEFWQVRRSGTGWATSWGAVTSTAGDGRNAPATGAGISRLAGVVRLDEIARGRIDHALVFSTDNACSGTFKYPATQSDGRSSRPDCIPEGGHIRLDPSIDVNTLPGLTPGERTIAKALQTYGAYAIDNGGAPIAFIFEAPNGRPDPYPAAGLKWDYYALNRIPWSRIQYLAR